MIRVANYGSETFDGWVRTTTDDALPHAGHLRTTGQDRAWFVKGAPVGIVGSTVDVRLRIDPGEIVELSEPQEAPGPFARGDAPSNPLAFFGGMATIGGNPLGFVGLTPNGSGYDLHMRARAGMFVADLWLTWYPDQPGWASGEVVVTCSNPRLPDITATVPEGFTLAFGDAVVLGFPDLGGESFADGQARGFPVTLAWPRHLVDLDYASAAATHAGSICARGMSTSWPSGNPAMPAGQTAADWVRSNYAGARALLSGWKAHPAGVLADSHATGKEGDQVFVGGPEAQPDGLGAEKVRYYLALGQLRRTTHHLEANGDLLNIDRHPSLVMWDGMPHYDPRQSPDQLGKSRRPNLLEAHGWGGNWEEHWLINGVATAYRLTGSRALQWELQHQARQFLFQVTLDPRKSTTRPGASRAVGYRGLVAYHLWHNLDDRHLANLVRERWVAHVQQVLFPTIGTKPAGIWQVQTDARLSADIGQSAPVWMPYQMAVGAYGLDLACEVLGPPEGRALAHQAARTVMDRAFDGNGDGWAMIRYSGADVVPLIEKEGAHYGENVWIWHTVGLATVLRHEPENERAQALWTRILVKQRAGGQWVPPEMLQ